MGAYRLYFRASGSIVARQDFDAVGDAAAQRIAAALLDACSDICGAVELWQGTRQLSLVLPGRGTGLGGLSDAQQEIAVKAEELIVRSEWSMAASRRLIERSRQLIDGLRQARSSTARNSK